TARLSPPDAAISFTSEASFSSLRAATATFAPAAASASAVSRPIPCEAPVTTATLSLSENIADQSSATAHFCKSLPVSVAPVLPLAPQSLQHGVERRGIAGADAFAAERHAESTRFDLHRSRASILHHESYALLGRRPHRKSAIGLLQQSLRSS